MIWCGYMSESPNNTRFYGQTCEKKSKIIICIYTCTFSPTPLSKISPIWLLVWCQLGMTVYCTFLCKLKSSLIWKIFQFMFLCNCFVLISVAVSLSGDCSRSPESLPQGNAQYAHFLIIVISFLSRMCFVFAIHSSFKMDI